MARHEITITVDGQHVATEVALLSNPMDFGAHLALSIASWTEEQYGVYWHRNLFPKLEAQVTVRRGRNEERFMTGRVIGAALAGDPACCPGGCYRCLTHNTGRYRLSEDVVFVEFPTEYQRLTCTMILARCLMPCERGGYTTLCRPEDICGDLSYSIVCSNHLVG